MRSIIVFSFLLVTCLPFINGSKILVLIAMSGRSHKNVFEPLIDGMAKRGHDLTVVSAYESKPQKNIKNLVPTKFAERARAFGENPIKTRSEGIMAMMAMDMKFIYDTCDEVYQNKEVIDLLKEKWDLVYISAFLNECLYGFIYKTGAPFVLVSTVAAPNQLTIYTGNRQPTSFVPSALFDYSDAMTFWQRMANFLYDVVIEVVIDKFANPKYEAIYRKHLGQDLPGVNEILSDVSAIFSNSHFALTFARPLLPDYLEVGGMHCRPSKPLPEDIEKFVADAKDGFVFFSLGSVVQAHTLPDNVRIVFRNVLGRLKQKVLWKWETGEMDDLPSNIKLLKWAPQQDILGHKNIKLFMTHGGLLSTQEATYHGVPLVGVPIFGDQDMNMKTAEKAGYALRVEIMDITEEKLEAAINRILSDQQFSKTAKELSSKFRDQPQTPLERAIFWSEYIIRHKGIAKSAARYLNVFQYHSIDVIVTSFP